MEKLGTKHRSLDNMIYDRLKAMIVERKLSPGEKIYQDKNIVMILFLPFQQQLANLLICLYYYILLYY